LLARAAFCENEAPKDNFENKREMELMFIRQTAFSRQFV